MNKAEYIEREKATEVLCDACGNAACPKGFIPRCSYYEKMQTIPAADVVEVRHGRGIVDEISTHELSYGTTAYEPVYKCSVCGRLTESYLRYDEPIMPEDADFPHYCPHCGADMWTPAGEQA